MTDGEDLCVWHSERWRDMRLANSGKGGSKRTVELPSAEALTPARTRELLAAASAGLLNGSIDGNTVRSLAYALMVDRQVRSTEQADLRLAELEERIAELMTSRNGGFRSTNGRSPVRRVSTDDLRRKARAAFGDGNESA